MTTKLSLSAQERKQKRNAIIVSFLWFIAVSAAISHDYGGRMYVINNFPSLNLKLGNINFFK